MERVGVRELRQNASRYLAHVKAGETVEVTERGELIALIVPPEPHRTTRDQLIAQGRLIPASRTFRLPTPVAARTSTTSVLDELRADR